MSKTKASVLLTKGEPTGAVLFRAADGVAKLQVRTGERGRGLFAAGFFKKGEIVTTIFGSLVHSSAAVADTHERYQWSKDQVFVMQYHGSHLGIFANTSASHVPNNCKYSCNRRQKDVMNLVASRCSVINDLPVTVDRYSRASQLGVVPWEFPIPKLALARRFSAGSVAIYLLVVPMTRVLILMRHNKFITLYR